MKNRSSFDISMLGNTRIRKFCRNVSSEFLCSNLQKMRVWSIIGFQVKKLLGFSQQLNNSGKSYRNIYLQWCHPMICFELIHEQPPQVFISSLQWCHPSVAVWYNWCPSSYFHAIPLQKHCVELYYNPHTDDYFALAFSTHVKPLQRVFQFY